MGSEVGIAGLRGEGRSVGGGVGMEEGRDVGNGEGWREWWMDEGRGEG